MRPQSLLKDLQPWRGLHSCRVISQLEYNVNSGVLMLTLEVWKTQEGSRMNEKI